LATFAAYDLFNMFCHHAKSDLYQCWRIAYDTLPVLQRLEVAYEL